MTQADNLKIIRFKEKHGDRIFLFSNYYERDLAVAQVAKSRLADGYWYDTTPKGEPELFRPNAHLSDAETLAWWIDRLDNPNLRRGKNGKPAPDSTHYLRGIYIWMCNRRDYQYEGFNEEHIEPCTLKVKEGSQ